jgi:hypothetical protein
MLLLLINIGVFIKNGPIRTTFVLEYEAYDCNSHATIGKEFVYYSGGGWSKGGFSDLAAWTAYMKDFALKLREPLKVSLEAGCAN